MSSVQHLLSNEVGLETNTIPDSPGNINNKDLKKTACSFCKKRKIKCSREIPCTSCIRYKNANCEYIQPTYKRVSKRSLLETELDVLKQKIMKLEQDKTIGGGVSQFDTVSDKASSNSNSSDSGKIFDYPSKDSLNRGYDSISSVNDSMSDFEFKDMELNYLNNATLSQEFDIFTETNISFVGINRRKAFSALGWRGMCNMDPALKVHWDYFSYIMQTKLSCQGHDTEQFEAELKKFGKVREANTSVNEAIRNHSKLVGLYSDASDDVGSNNKNLELLHQIQKILPSKKVIWKLIRIFNETMFTCYPIYNDVYFKTNILRIFGDYELNLEDDTKPVLNIQSKTDFAYLGILLITLRLGYITLFSGLKENNDIYFSNDPDPKIQEQKYLLNNPIQMECVSLSQECLNQFNLLDPICSEVFQLLAVTYMYRTYAPEHGLEPNSVENNTLRSLVLQTAFSMGFNIDKSLNSNSENATFGTNVWRLLVLDDVTTSFLNGYPLLHSVYPFENKPLKSLYPASFSEMKMESIVDLNKVKGERLMLLCSELTTKVINLCKGFLTKLTDPNQSLKIKEVFKFLEVIDTEFTKPNGIFQFTDANIKKIPNLDAKLVGTIKFKLELVFKYSSIPYYFKLFNHFEKIGEYSLSFYCLKKILNNQLVDNPKIYDIINEPSGANTLIIPLLLIILHKSLLANLAIFVRLQINDDKNYKLAQDLLLQISKNITHHISLVDKLANRYFYAWYISKAVNCSFIASSKIIEDIKLQELNFDLEFPMFREQKVLTGLIDIFSNMNNRSTGGVDFYEGDSKNIDELWFYLTNMNTPNDDTLNISVMNDFLKDVSFEL